MLDVAGGSLDIHPMAVRSMSALERPGKFASGRRRAPRNERAQRRERPDAQQRDGGDTRNGAEIGDGTSQRRLRPHGDAGRGPRGAGCVHPAPCDLDAHGRPGEHECHKWHRLHGMKAGRVKRQEVPGLADETPLIGAQPEAG